MNAQSDLTPVPEFFREDAKGRLVPISNIKAIDIERSDLVEALFAKAKQQQAVLREFKAQAFADVAAFVQLSAEQYGVTVGG